MSKCLCFLGFNREKTRLIDFISDFGWRVVWTDKEIDDLSPFDAVVSFGYRHVLRQNVIKTSSRPIINLHISYLPWNRGSHPLFWAAYDGTPNGVSIHEIDSGIDTGPICFQRLIKMDYDKETFESGYRLLINSIEELFMRNAEALLGGDYTSIPQMDGGTFRKSKDLPSGFSWSECIAPTIDRLKSVTAR